MKRYLKLRVQRRNVQIVLQETAGDHHIACIDTLFQTACDPGENNPANTKTLDQCGCRGRCGNLANF